MRFYNVSIFETYLETAERANIDVNKYNVNELFFKCIEFENDEYFYNAYMSALIYKLRGYAGRIYTQCKKHLSFEQCYDILLDTINYVLEKRTWENPESSLYNDKSAPDKAFHIVLKRQRGILLASLNADKRVANFNPLSIDGFHESYSDAAEGLLDIYSEDNSEYSSLIAYIKTKEPLEIIILDHICFSDWKSYESIARAIKALDCSRNNVVHFSKKYELNEQIYKRTIEKISNRTINKLIEDIKKTIYKCRKDYE